MGNLAERSASRCRYSSGKIVGALEGGGKMLMLVWWSSFPKVEVGDDPERKRGRARF
jgi:hypothetical protein